MELYQLWRMGTNGCEHFYTLFETIELKIWNSASLWKISTVLSVNIFGRHNNCLFPSVWVLSGQFCRHTFMQSGLGSKRAECNSFCLGGFQASKVKGKSQFSSKNVNSRHVTEFFEGNLWHSRSPKSVQFFLKRTTNILYSIFSKLVQK